MFGAAAVLEQYPGDVIHDTGLVQAGADDHHGDNGNDRITGEAVEQMLCRDKRFVHTQHRSDQAHQPQQHHNTDRRYIDVDDFENKQINC